MIHRFVYCVKTLAGIVLGAGLMLGTANAQVSGYVKNYAGQGLSGKIVTIYQTFSTDDTTANFIWHAVTNSIGKFNADPWTTDVHNSI